MSNESHIDDFYDAIDRILGRPYPRVYIESDEFGSRFIVARDELIESIDTFLEEQNL